MIRNNNAYMQRVYVNIVREVEGSTLVFKMREDLGPFIVISLFIVVSDLFLSKDIIQGLPFYGPILFGLRIFSYLFFRFDAACIRRKLLRIFE